MEIKYSVIEEKKLISTIKSMKVNNVFKNYINKITFPYYKNLIESSFIDFSFPLTTIVGPNGTGKSSILRALQGVIYNRSPGNYWFSTAVDPIKETGKNGVRNCFYYEYLDENNELKEVLKQRAPRKEDPDYWETSRPVLKYGMKKLPDGIDRNAAVKRKVVYLDFRSELSSFDKYFHIGTSNDKDLKNKKKYIRNQSVKLKNIIETNKVNKIKTKNQNKKPIDITKEELKWISFILGKNYYSGKIIEHKIFKYWGTSVILNEDSFVYSEAVAGSGEIAIVKIVHELLKADTNSLILLDEPEVSVHPGAQSKLKFFILNLIKTKKFQVIVSTHSTTFIEQLPENAIKKLSVDNISKKVHIKNECLMQEAFNALGQRISNLNINIQVEDELAKKLIECIICEIDEGLSKNCNIYFYPGGSATIMSRHIPHYSQDQSQNTFVIFDGDQNRDVAFDDVNELSQNDFNNNVLGKKISEITGKGIDTELITDGNKKNKKRIDQTIELQKKVYEFYKNRVYYLPLNTPEEIIWSEEAVRELILDSKKVEEILNAESHKDKIYKVSKTLLARGHNLNFEDLLILKWMQKKTHSKEEIIRILKDILNKANQSY